MAKKTLYVFRAENGIWRNELSKKIGIDEQTLKQIEDEPEVPQEIAEKVVVAYGLPEDYFTVDPNAKDKRYKPKNPFKYFLKVSLVWEFLIALIFAVVMFPTTMAGAFGAGDNPLFNLLETLCKALIIAFSGIYLTSHIVKKTVYGKQVTQYDYIYPYLPAQIALSLKIVVQLVPTLLSQKTDNPIILIAVSGVYGFVALVVQGIFTAVLLKSRVEEDEKKRTKTVKKLSVLAIISTTVYTLFVISASMVSSGAVAPLQLATLLLELILLIAVAFGIIIGEKRFSNLNKLWFVVLPLTAMLLPTFINVIGKLF
ncbi:MAG: helix-turn-helix transcriptional regulator [Clostridia bacterium]|nr:helix-turn-helix transcriptional regulator [Clostridia bacterium]